MPVSVFTPIQDVYIASAYPDRNFFNRVQGDVLFAGTFTSAEDIYRSLLQFSLTDPNHGIPPNSTIQDATLTLHMYRNDNPGVGQLLQFTLLDFFNQATVTFSTSPPSAGPGSVLAVPAAPAMVNIPLGSIVRGWYEGNIPNNGIEIRGTENANDNILGFRSTRFPDSRLWPSLSVTWDKGTLSSATFENLSGAPTLSAVVNMEGQDQVTFLVNNLTNGNLEGAVQVLQPGGLIVDDPATAFVIPAGGQRVVSYIAAVSVARLHFTAAGTGFYQVSAATRDE